MPEGGELPGEVAFKLYDTYGFPLDLTQDYLKSKSIKVDTSIFESKHWVQNGDKQAMKYISISGHGSNINTKQSNNLISLLLIFFEKYQINSLLDMPCGDFLWMREFLKKKSEIKYLGIDYHIGADASYLPSEGTVLEIGRAHV